MTKKLDIESLNENERKALEAIVETCDDIDGDLFTRRNDAVLALVKLFKDGFRAGGYYIDLLNKGYIDEEPDDFYGTGLWVNA